MEVRAWIYFSFWSITGPVALFFGIKILDQTDFACSISPVVMSFFKNSLAISTCHSSTYSLILRSKLMASAHFRDHMWVFFAVLPPLYSRIDGSSAVWCFPIYSFIKIFGAFYYFLPQMKTLVADKYLHLTMCTGIALFPLLYHLFRETVTWYILIGVPDLIVVINPSLSAQDEEIYCRTVYFFVMWSFVFPDGTTNLFPVLVIVIALCTCILRAALTGEEPFRRWLPKAIHDNEFLSAVQKMMKKWGKLLEFAFGMVGTILFQNFFRLTSFRHILAFLYLTVAWLSNIALLMTRYDFGVFNFFLTNVIVGCTVSEFGLRGTTWLAYGASILLYGLRLKLESLTLVKAGDGKDVIAWRE